MIIGLFGRSKSGKHELATVCEDLGYEIIFFASALKDLVGKLIGHKVDSTQESKERIVNLKLNDEQLNYLSNELKINIDNIKEIIGEHTFYDVREMLQIIGTDLIRTYNPNWHVEKLKEQIKPNKNYVIDDCRFPNEKKMIEDLNGECWFIVRPINVFSNHESETALRWQDFDNVIINNRDLGFLKLNWNIMLSSYDEFMKARKNIIDKCRGIDNVEKAIKEHGKNNFIDMINSVCLSMDYLKYTPRYETNEYIENIELIKLNENDKYSNCYYQVDVKDIGTEIGYNPLIIENLKFFL